MARGRSTWSLLLIAAGVAIALALRPRTASAMIGPASSSGGDFPGGAAMDPSSLTRANSSLAQRQAAYAPYFAAAEEQYGIPTGLLLQQGIAESSLDASAVSPAGAVGIMQMMPRYFPSAGADPIADIESAAKEMARLFGVFGSWTLALAGYNAGQGAVTAAGPAVPNYPETVAYVEKITAAAGINEPGVAWA